MLPDKKRVLSLIIKQLKNDLLICSKAVEVARDTATHKDCLGSSKYETMGTEASYLAHGQGTRLLELERALAYFKQLTLLKEPTKVELSTLISLEDEYGKQQLLWLAADAGGLKVECDGNLITVITNKSPLGRAVMGKSKGDDFELKIAKSFTTYEIQDIS